MAEITETKSYTAGEINWSALEFREGVALLTGNVTYHTEDGSSFSKPLTQADYEALPKDLRARAEALGAAIEEALIPLKFVAGDGKEFARDGRRFVEQKTGAKAVIPTKRA